MKHPQSRFGARGSQVSALAIASALVLAACGGGRAPSPDAWAIVDGREILRDDVERAYRAAVQRTEKPPSDEERLVAQMGVLEELITQNILMARARASGIEVTEEEVDKAFAEKRGTMTDEAMSRQLSDRNLTREDVRAVIRRELIVNKLLERDVVAKAAVTDAEIEAFFQANRAQFNIAEAQYRIAQIVVTPRLSPQTRNRMNDDAGSPQQAEQKTRMIFEKLKAGADFQQLAADYSEDPQSAANGGDLGFIPDTALRQAPPQLRDLVLKMTPGNVNTIIVNGNYTIVLLVAHEAPGQRDLSAPGVKDQIRDGLRERKDRLLRTAYLTEARNSATIDNRLARMLVESQGKPPAGLLAAPGAAK
ncbi:MAG TPA: SurA N-terminal domain-containing protein [Vicinamibacterales bacterium]|nr:SurA N-terminal domain-containing protein [Vicinamibacterales bacterium]